MARKKRFIPKERRQAMRARAEAAATRQHAPLLDAAQGGVRQANREFRREKQSVVGADTLLQRAMTQQFKGARKSGLKGRYKQETLAELRSIKAGSKAAIPGFLADASAARRDAVAEARLAVAKESADRDVTAAKKFNTLLDQGIKKKTAAVKAKREKAAKGKPTLNRSAVIAAKALMDKWTANTLVERTKEDGTKEMVPFREANPLQTEAQVREMALALSKTKGVSVADAMRALAVVRRRDRKRKGYGASARGSAQANIG